MGSAASGIAKGHCQTPVFSMSSGSDADEELRESLAMTHSLAAARIVLFYKKIYEQAGFVEDLNRAVTFDVIDMLSVAVAEIYSTYTPTSVCASSALLCLSNTSLPVLSDEMQRTHVAVTKHNRGSVIVVSDINLLMNDVFHAMMEALLEWAEPVHFPGERRALCIAAGPRRVLRKKFGMLVGKGTSAQDLSIFNHIVIRSTDVTEDNLWRIVNFVADGNTLILVADVATWHEKTKTVVRKGMPNKLLSYFGMAAALLPSPCNVLLSPVTDAWEATSRHVLNFVDGLQSYATTACMQLLVSGFHPWRLRPTTLAKLTQMRKIQESISAPHRQLCDQLLWNCNQFSARCLPSLAATRTVKAHVRPQTWASTGLYAIAGREVSIKIDNWTSHTGIQIGCCMPLGPSSSTHVVQRVYMSDINSESIHTIALNASTSSAMSAQSIDTTSTHTSASTHLSTPSSKATQSSSITIRMFRSGPIYLIDASHLTSPAISSRECQVTAQNVVSHPVFQRGVSNHREWTETMTKLAKEVDYVDLQGYLVTISLPAEDCQFVAYRDPGTCLELMDSIFFAMEELCYIVPQTSQYQRYRIVVDQSMAADSDIVPGYPLQVPPTLMLHALTDVSHDNKALVSIIRAVAANFLPKCWRGQRIREGALRLLTAACCCVVLGAKPADKVLSFDVKTCVEQRLLGTLLTPLDGSQTSDTSLFPALVLVVHRFGWHVFGSSIGSFRDMSISMFPQSEEEWEEFLVYEMSRAAHVQLDVFFSLFGVVGHTDSIWSTRALPFFVMDQPFSCDSFLVNDSHWEEVRAAYPRWISRSAKLSNAEVTGARELPLSSTV